MNRDRWLVPGAVGVGVLCAQLMLMAGAGTDIPFQDQWDVVGRPLLPAWRDGTWSVTELWRPHNEHRILWTKALDVALFAVNGQWDPLVELVAGAVVRATAAAVLAGLLVRRGAAALAWGIGVAFLPHLPWHNVLWGFQSQVEFCLLFSVLALAWLGAVDTPRWQRWTGLAAGMAALLAMGAGALVPVALLGIVALRAVEQRRLGVTAWRGVAWAATLLAAALALRSSVPELAGLRAADAGQFLRALGRALGWPHTGQPLAAVVMCLPLAAAVGLRLAGRRGAAAGEDFVLLLGGWAIAIAAAAAWSRGGGGEFDAGVPSRYVDFLVLLPLANAWCAWTLVREAADRWRRGLRMVAVAWGGFLVVGWAGLSVETMRRIVGPRWRDREAPVRLAREFQRTGDPAVFAGQPRLLVPHPNPESVRSVLGDPRMRGALPPSLQPEQPMGPLSRATRTLLGRQ